MKDKIKAHRIRTEDIVDSWDSSIFSEIVEQNINEDEHTVSGACIFGTRFSANGYVYQDAAVDKLTQLANGTKFFIDHPSKDEQKQRDGVRPMTSWAGVFSNSRRQGDKVYADLKVRESWWPLVRDVAVMRPPGIGNSINSRVKVFKNEKGEESILDIDLLKSVDLVSSAATTQDLFQHMPDLSNKEEEMEIKEFFKQFNIETEQEDLEAIMKSKIDKVIKEGLLKDKLKERDINKAISQLNWDVSDVVDQILRSDKAAADKKKEISSVMDDWESEITKILNGNIKKKTDGKTDQSDSKEREMKIEELTLDLIKNEKPDLIEQILAELGEAERVKTLEAENETMSNKIKEMEESIKSKDEEITALKTENEDLKKKVDEYEQKDKKVAKEALIQEKLKEVKLPDEAMSDVFMADLMLKDEEGIEAAIKDRKELWSKGSGKVKNVGESFDDKQEPDKDKREKAKGSFTSKLK